MSRIYKLLLYYLCCLIYMIRSNILELGMWTLGYTVYEALNLARNQIYSESGSYWGSDSYIIMGNGSLKMN